MRSPARPACRPVKIEVAAPTAKSASTEITAETTVGAVPRPNKNGMSGSNAPNAKARNEEIAATHGDPSRARVEPELLAGQGVERDVATDP